jgi:hypothetical protein
MTVNMEGNRRRQEEAGRGMKTKEEAEGGEKRREGSHR